MSGIDVEFLREMFADKKIHIAMGEIEDVEVLVDFSSVRVQLKLPQHDDLEVVARMAWGMCSSGGGAFQLPVKGDGCLVAYTSPDQAFVFAHLSSLSDRVPLRASTDAATVVAAKDGQDLDLNGKAVRIGRGTPLMVPGEPLVLGAQLKTYLEGLSDRLSAIYDLLIAGAFLFTTSPGNPTAPNPASAALMTAAKTEHELAKAQFLTVALTNILSEVGFTEK